MLTLIFVYLVLPFLLAGLVIRFIKTKGGPATPPWAAEIHARDPVGKGLFRVVRIEAKTSGGAAAPRALGDYPSHGDAVEAAYLARSKERPPARAEFFVLNDKGEVVEGV